MELSILNTTVQNVLEAIFKKENIEHDPQEIHIGKFRKFHKFS